MAATWFQCFLVVASGLLFTNAAALNKRSKRETLSHGWLSSPGYHDSPNSQYPNNYNQEFVIQTDPVRDCVVTITYVADIEWSSNCVYDRLILNVGSADERVVCGNTNGQYVTYNTTVSGGNDVLIQFMSDQSVPARGFTLEYTVEPIEPSPSLYGNTLYTTVAPYGRSIEGRQSSGNYVSELWDNSGTFTSPNYPNSPYPGNYDGSYLAHLDGPGPQQVRVTYEYDIEYQSNCLFDYLEFVDTSQRICGYGQNEQIITVPGDTFELRFHSDNSDNRGGFKVDYQVLGPLVSGRSLSIASDDETSNTTDAAFSSTGGGFFFNNNTFENNTSTENNTVTFENNTAAENNTGSFETSDWFSPVESNSVFLPENGINFYPENNTMTENNTVYENGTVSENGTFWQNDTVSENDAVSEIGTISENGTFPENGTFTFWQNNTIPTPENSTVSSAVNSQDFAEATMNGPEIFERVSPENNLVLNNNEAVQVGECELCSWTAEGDYEYAFNHRMLTFDQAVTACSVCGGEMITAQNQQEADLTRRILALLSGAEDVPHWLGATDRQTEGQWSWLDGSPLTYSLWKRREPDNMDGDMTNADCLLVNSKGQWRDEQCSSTRKSICRRPLGTTVASCTPTEPLEERVISDTSSGGSSDVIDTVSGDVIDPVQIENINVFLPSEEIRSEPTVNEVPPVNQIENISVLLPSEPESECCSLSNWTTFGDLEYSYNRQGLTFDLAVSACSACGGQLITAINDDEFQLTQRIFAQLSGADDVPHWLGATDRQTEGQWSWLDGSPLTYSQWKRREPDNVDDVYTNADCLVVNSKGQWRDQECGHLRKSLCKRPAGTTVTPLPVCQDGDINNESNNPPAPSLLPVTTPAGEATTMESRSFRGETPVFPTPAETVSFSSEQPEYIPYTGEGTTYSTESGPFERTPYSYEYPTYWNEGRYEYPTYNNEYPTSNYEYPTYNNEYPSNNVPQDSYQNQGSNALQCFMLQNLWREMNELNSQLRETMWKWQTFEQALPSELNSGNPIDDTLVPPVSSRPLQVPQEVLNYGFDDQSQNSQEPFAYVG